MLLRLGQPCVFAQSCLCDRTGDDVKLGLSCSHLQGLFTRLCCVDHASFVPQLPRYTCLGAALQALQAGLICLLSSEFAVTPVIWKWTWWIHVCGFYGVFPSGRCVSVIYLVCLLRICWALWLPSVPAWGTRKNIWPSVWTPSETWVWSPGWVSCILIPWACQPKDECKNVIPLELYST